MTEELMRIPGALRKLDVENNSKLMTLFDVDWRPEKIQEIKVFEGNLKTLIMMLNTTIEHMKDRPNYYVDEVLDTLARIYLELGKCAAYVYAMDDLIKQVVIRKTHILVKPDEN